MIPIEQWWQKLPVDVQERLKRGPATNLSAADVVAIVQAGRPVAGAHWVGQDDPHFNLADEEQDFIRGQE